MIGNDETIVLGDLLQAYGELDEAGRRVFACALLHVWAGNAARFFGSAAGQSGGHRRAGGRAVLDLPACDTFGRALELPMAGIFENGSRTD